MTTWSTTEQTVTWTSTAGTTWRVVRGSTGGGGGGGASAINDLTDVDTATDPPATGDVLAWNGTLWTPAALTAADMGAIPASIIDAKGDLLVGTAADTAARLGVGTDGQVLTADSAETSGVKWAAAAGGGGVATDPIFDAKGDLVVGTGANTAARLAVGSNGMVPIADSGSTGGMRWGRTADAPVAYVAGRWYSTPRNVAGTQSYAGNYIRMHPFVPHSMMSIDRLACYATATAGGKARLGIYLGDGVDGYAGSLVVDAGEVDTSTTGDKLAVCSATLQAGVLYWFAVNSNVTTSLAHVDIGSGVASTWGGGLISNPGGNPYCYMASSYGALPATVTSTPWGNNPPYLIVRAA